jgi:D,D-heptose 1,7-bisphosphate phosphatase
VPKKLLKKIKNSPIKQAVILCGGIGSRLGNITKKTPKPLIEIGKKPFLDYLIDNLIKYEVERILLLCSYKSNKFFKKYHNKKINKLTKIICIDEKKQLGTGGAIINAKKKLDDYFYLINGDTFFEGDLFQLNENFDRTKYDVIIASQKIYNERYGSIELRNDIVKKFNVDKKKKLSNINLGTYIINKKILNKYKKIKISLENNILPDLTKRKKIQCFSYEKKFFIDIGIKKDLQKAKKILPKIKYPTVFLDRDGVINLNLGYVSKIKNFHFTKNIFKAIKYFNRKNYLVFIVTNQSGIGRGYYTEKKMKDLHLWMKKKFKNNLCRIDDIFYAPYYKFSNKYSLKEHYNLRKPNIGMYNLALKKWPIDKKKLIMIGDSEIDLIFGKKINAKTIIVKENKDIFKQILKFV